MDLVREHRNYLILGLILLIILGYMLISFIDVLIYSVFIYYITNPVKNRIYRIIKSDASISLSLFVFVLPMILISIYAGNVALFELSQFTSDIWGGKPPSLLKFVEVYGKSNMINKIYIKSENVISMGFDIITLLGNVILKTFLAFIIGFYLIKDGSKIRQWFLGTLSLFISEKERETVEKFLDSLDRSFHTVFFGNILTVIATSFIGVCFFHIFNIFAPLELQIPYPLLFGIFCGLATLVPGIGIKTIWVPIFLYLALQAYLKNMLSSDILYLLIFLVGVNVFVDFTPDILLRPLVSGKNIHKGALMLTYIFSPLVFGFIGIFLGPILLISLLNFSKIILPELSNRSKKLQRL